ncbi:cellulose synthase/poly-beta-1,6-N-acetylglucosamine synthase-like glycosyltransferase [Frondihabitans sp. PhB188]|uniref:glycosyltransferase family 2 protein n=1 Tax=Frondihabitans sp. PhB188 TaxID=2485200 RepID=UPI000F490EB4|nr:glycosyltransferase [Frondihabitans sp. PhB188]ROQ30945.1 cellulose synthase/poly-beta-1,6-N-acetylglucosamine synthase-like glycosyltransferase [Frondihabitans sp. PhB188]
MSTDNATSDTHTTHTQGRHHPDHPKTTEPAWTIGIDVTLVRAGSGPRYISEDWLPIRHLPDNTLLVATAERHQDAALKDALSDEFETTVVFTRVPPWQLKSTVLRLFGDKVADDAANALFYRNPELSGRIVFSRGQKISALVVAIVLVALAIIWPRQTAIGVLATVSLVFLAGTAFKFFVSLQGARFDVVERITDTEVAELSDDDLPVYTVLVPVFHEANIVAQLIDNLGGLDYPVHKLEVLILIEEEDLETRQAIENAEPPAHFHIVTVPKGHPQTKPRACNVGLYLASGSYLVIYDAEDTPDPDQLKKALIAFDRGGDETVCVQAALNYFNATENALTRMFTLEYSYWFDYMLAGLDRSNLPIPLGGTSNHFRTEALIELGGWDPYNVTEDADLGIRASAIGYRVGVINSTTMEEANTSIPNFIRQRSRWIKGYMQTTLVHARRPVALIREVGIVRFLAFALLIGGTPATFLGVIPFYLVTAASLAIPSTVISSVFPAWVLWICLFNFLIGNGIMVYLSMMGPFKRGTFNLILWSLLNPVYWILHSLAAYKGLWQLLTRPHYWEKTEHGLTQQSN